MKRTAEKRGEKGGQTRREKETNEKRRQDKRNKENSREEKSRREQKIAMHMVQLSVRHSRHNTNYMPINSILKHGSTTQESGEGKTNVAEQKNRNKMVQN
jgi:hypothetical protein